MVDVAVILACGLEHGLVGPRQAKGVQPESFPSGRAQRTLPRPSDQVFSCIASLIMKAASVRFRARNFFMILRR